MVGAASEAAYVIMTNSCSGSQQHHDSSIRTSTANSSSIAPAHVDGSTPQHSRYADSWGVHSYGNEPFTAFVTDCNILERSKQG